MTVFRLSKTLAFPHPSLAEPDGLLAVGGDLSPERLLLAYRNGIFPWYSQGRPILWWCTRPRFVLFPEELHLGRSLRKTLRRRPYRITCDEAFDAVIERCAAIARPNQDSTWLIPAMQAAYRRLHELGFAHSIEAWDGSTLVGGLYGVSIGASFSGESMFSERPNASKVAFASLVLQLRRWHFHMIDCQLQTQHLTRFGARPVPLEQFLERLYRAVEVPKAPGVWTFDADLERDIEALEQHEP